MGAMKPIDPAARRSLKARAHALSPVVIVSSAGLSEGVVAEIDRGLKAHELIKIRVTGEDRVQREALLAQICARSGATAVQHIGKVLVIYRENPGTPSPASRRSAARSGKRPRRAAAPERRSRPPARKDRAPERKSRPARARQRGPVQR